MMILQDRPGRLEHQLTLLHGGVALLNTVFAVEKRPVLKGLCLPAEKAKGVHDVPAYPVGLTHGPACRGTHLNDELKSNHVSREFYMTTIGQDGGHGD